MVLGGLPPSRAYPCATRTRKDLHGFSEEILPTQYLQTKKQRTLVLYPALSFALNYPRMNWRPAGAVIDMTRSCSHTLCLSCQFTTGQMCRRGDSSDS